MLLTEDNHLTEISVDASGRPLIDKQLPSVDASGRPYTEPEAKSEENSQTASQEKPETAPAEQTTEIVKEPTEKEARKLFLQAQKAERRAKEMEKKAAESLKKAEAFDKAKALVDSGEDPTALITAAGYDPVDFYKKMTAYALSDKGKPEDPVQKQLREQQARIEASEKANKELTQSLNQEKELAQHQSVINTKVIPVLQANPDKYEALHAQYGNQTAVEVYKAVYEHYQQTGEVVSFEQAADQMENYWINQYESGINQASKLKKLSKFFAQTQSPSPDTSSDLSEKPRRSNTLSNKNTISAAPPANKQYDRYRSSEERRNELLKKFGE